MTPGRFHLKSVRGNLAENYAHIRYGIGREAPVMPGAAPDAGLPEPAWLPGISLLPESGWKLPPDPCPKTASFLNQLPLVYNIFVFSSAARHNNTHYHGLRRRYVR